MDFFKSPEFAARVEQLINKYHIPGFAAAVVHNDEVASKAFGHATLDPPTPMTTGTLLDIASASKSMTAASVALLVDDDEKYPEVRYDAKMADLLPGDFVMPEGYEGVTVEDILSHRSGMANNDDSFLGPRAKHTDTPLSVTRNLRNLTAAAPLRTKFIYCNMMFTAATVLVEKKSGLSFADFLEQRFFAPLGMTASNLQPGRARANGLGDRISPGHWWDKKEQAYVAFDLPDAPEAQGAGSIVTCVDDYIKYVRALMNKGGPFTEDVYNGLIRARTIISPDYDEVSPFSAPPMYAAGWEVHHYRGVKIVVHEGNICGSSSSHFFVPEYKFGAVMLGNTSLANLVSEILMQELIDRVLGLPDAQLLNWDEQLMNKYEPEAVFGEEDSSYEADKADADKRIEELRQKLCPGITEPEPQKMPLSAYTGEYWNPGWRGVTVEVKDGGLFIDCSDRTYVFNMTLEHVCEQTKYVAHMKSAVFGQPFGQVQAEFRFSNNVAAKIGIWFEEDIDDYVWFDRVENKH